MIKSSNTLIDRDLSNLAPFFRIRLEKALKECHEDAMQVYLFEGYRSPERQIFLFGQNQPGKWVTSATAWKSWHQYGLACDLAFKKAGQWSWDAKDPWERVHSIFKKNGFQTIKAEKGHFQITGGLTIETAYLVYRNAGREKLWELVEQKIAKNLQGVKS